MVINGVRLNTVVNLKNSIFGLLYNTLRASDAYLGPWTE